MTYGNCRVTILDENGRPEVADVKEGDLWYFPAGLPHSLQGLDPDGCEFVLAFDNGESSEFNTLLLTDWIAHPPEVLAKNFGVPVEAFKNIPVHNKWIYQTQSLLFGVRRGKAALSSGCKSHPANAPAGSNRSSYGGNEMAEALFAEHFAHRRKPIFHCNVLPALILQIARLSHKTDRFGFATLVQAQPRGGRLFLNLDLS